MDLDRHTIGPNQTVIQALELINSLGEAMILFVIGQEGRLVGTLTDGDIRRALVARKPLNVPVREIMQRNFEYLKTTSASVVELSRLRTKGMRYIPLVDDSNRIQRVINLDHQRSYLPLQAVIMAGGEGRRLRPLTERTPKPLLKVGGKPIIQYNIEHLVRFGVEKITISIRYLGEQLRNYLGDGGAFGCMIDYVEEKDAKGTIGALAEVRDSIGGPTIVMNSDLLTNLDLEHQYLDFVNNEAALSVATIPYPVKIPYAVLETAGGTVKALKEKPEYMYHSNAGIYMVGREALDEIPGDRAYNATDLIESLIGSGERVISYPLRGYWLDIGKPEDFVKAQEDVQHIRF